MGHRRWVMDEEKAMDHGHEAMRKSKGQKHIAQRRRDAEKDGKEHLRHFQFPLRLGVRHFFSCCSSLRPCASAREIFFEGAGRENRWVKEIYE